MWTLGHLPPIPQPLSVGEWITSVFEMFVFDGIVGLAGIFHWITGALILVFPLMLVVWVAFVLLRKLVSRSRRSI